MSKRLRGEFKKPEERKAFIAWHQEQVENNYLFDFRKEIIKYCRSDVDIMRKCCLLYREMFRKETDIDPFDKSLTIASYCHEVYRTNFLKKDTIAIFYHDRQLKTKQSNMAVKWLSYIMEKKTYTFNTSETAGRNVSGGTRWMVIAKRPIRPMNFKDAFGTVRTL